MTSYIFFRIRDIPGFFTECPQCGEHWHETLWDVFMDTGCPQCRFGGYEALLDEQYREWMDYRWSSKYHQDRARQRRKERMNTLPNNYTDEMWQTALHYWNSACAVCGNKSLSLAKDHWYPLAAANCPGTVPTNIVPLCCGYSGCNNLKASTHPYRWLYRAYGKPKALQIGRRIEAFFAYMAERFPVEE